MNSRISVEIGGMASVFLHFCEGSQNISLMTRHVYIASECVFYGGDPAIHQVPQGGLQGSIFPEKFVSESYVGMSRQVYGRALYMGGLSL